MKKLILILFSLGLFAFLSSFLSGDYRIWVMLPDPIGTFIWALGFTGVLAVLGVLLGIVFIVAIVLLLKKNHWSIRSFFREFSPFEIRYIFFGLLVSLCVGIVSVIF